MSVRDAASRVRRRQREIICSLLLAALVAPLVPAQSPCYPSAAASASCCETACSVAAARAPSSADCCTTVMRGERRPSFVPASGEDGIRAALAVGQAFASPVAARPVGLAGGNRSGQPPPPPRRRLGASATAAAQATAQAALSLTIPGDFTLYLCLDRVESRTGLSSDFCFSNQIEEPRFQARC